MQKSKLSSHTSFEASSTFFDSSTFASSQFTATKMSAKLKITAKQRILLVVWFYQKYNELANELVKSWINCDTNRKRTIVFI